MLVVIMQYFIFLVLRQIDAVVIGIILMIHMQEFVFLILKKLNVKVFNLMSRTNETRSIKWHETCKCICRLNKIICNNKQRWNKDKYRCECKELIDKGFIWNPSNCGCECANACNTVNIQVIQIVSVKKEIDPLIEECTENDDDETNMVNKTITKYGDETKLVNKTMTKNENSYCNSCKV